MKSIKTMLAYLLVLVVLATGCSSKTLLEKEEAVNLEQQIRTKKDSVIGDVKKEGVELEIPENTFDEKVNVMLTAYPGNKSVGFSDRDFDIFGAPVSIEVEGSESTRLNQPVKIAVSIPKTQLKEIESPDEVFAAYYNSGWEYFIPDEVDLKKGIVEFTTYHFSDFGAGKLSREKQLEYHAQKMAVHTWSKNDTQKKFADATKSHFYELLENKLGIADEDVKGKILRNMVKENDFGNLIVSLEKGDMEGFETKLGEMTGKVILEQAQLDPGFMGKWATISSTGAKAAANALEGDYEQAMKEISLALMDQHILGKLFLAGVEVTDAAIKDWKDKSIEDAFQAYKNGADGEHGYDLDAGDFQSLLGQMRGISHKIYSDAIDAYCQKHNIKENKLDKATLEQIRAETDRKLEAEFKKRVAEDNEIEAQKSHHLRIIKAFENSLLLKKGSFGYDRDTTLERRIERLHIVMENILEHTGMKLNTQLIDSTDKEMSLDDMCTLIGVWYNDKTPIKEEYFAKLREMGFIKETEQTGEGGYAWVFEKTIDEKGEDYLKQQQESGGPYKDVVTYGENNFSIQFNYTGPSDNYYTPPMIQGESIKFTATFTKPPKIIEAGETVSIDMTLEAGGNSLSYFSPFASAKGQMTKNDQRWWDFVNEDGEDRFRTDINNNYMSYGETITATAPSGGEGDVMYMKFHLYTGPKLETTYVYNWEKVKD